MAVRRWVRGQPEEVYAFLADLDNHWCLHDRHLRLEHLHADRQGGIIGLGGPIGLRRTVRIIVTTRDEPRQLGGRAQIGRRTTAQVNWNIEAQGVGARVELVAVVLTAGPLDRLLLAVGGRRWLSRRFDAVLAALSAALVAGETAGMGRSSAGGATPSLCRAEAVSGAVGSATNEGE